MTWMIESDRTLVLSTICKEPEGEVERSVYFAPLTVARLRHYWEKLSQFTSLFNRHIKNDSDFISTFLSQDGAGNLQLNGIIWEVDDVGIFYLTDIYPLYQATGHFTFWDRRIRGREPLIQRMIKFAFDEYNFHRIIAEVPLYSNPTMNAIERVGFTKEGRLRKATHYKNEWWDVNLYSILKEEIDGILET